MRVLRGAAIQLIAIIAWAACTVLCVHPQGTHRSLHLSSLTRHSGSTGNKTGPGSEEDSSSLCLNVAIAEVFPFSSWPRLKLRCGGGKRSSTINHSLLGQHSIITRPHNFTYFNLEYIPASILVEKEIYVSCS